MESTLEENVVNDSQVGNVQTNTVTSGADESSSAVLVEASASPVGEHSTPPALPAYQNLQPTHFRLMELFLNAKWHVDEISEILHFFLEQIRGLAVKVREIAEALERTAHSGEDYAPLMDTALSTIEQFLTLMDKMHATVQRHLTSAPIMEGQGRDSIRVLNLLDELERLVAGKSTNQLL